MELLKFFTVYLIAILIVCLVAIYITGCQQAIYEVDGLKKRVQVNTLFMHLDFKKLSYKEFFIEEYDADAQEVDIKTPYGVIGTGNE